jgi:hypothetical protein
VPVPLMCEVISCVARELATTIDEVP